MSFEAKKQHQTGWGEGDDGEERLGQFFRLKDRVGLKNEMVTIWLFNIAMENHHF